MLHGASNCEHISAEAGRTQDAAGTVPKSAMGPVFRGLGTLASITVLTAFLTGSSGCSSSVPRFRSDSSDYGGRRNADADEERFASKIREEETREDDRRVDIAALRERLTPSIKNRPAENAPLPPGLNRDRILLDIVGFLGVPYSYGGDDKSGIDCSGFTAQVYRAGAGRLLPRSTEDQFSQGSEVDRDSLRFGDLVFFNTTGRIPSHVGIYIEDDLFAHASITYGVTISSLESTYYRERFVGARRIFR
jgi:lipoprotein Spr